MEIANLILEFIKVFIWPIVVTIAFILFRKQICYLFSHLRKVDLPGGFSIDFPYQLDEAKILSERIAKTSASEQKKEIPSIPITEANARMISLGLRPSPSGLDMTYYKDLAAQDPNIALGGLRIELEILAKNLAQGFGIEINPRDSGFRLLKKLRDSNAITTEQMELAQSIWQLCNAAVHRRVVSFEEASSIIEIANVLRDQYLSWLSWGFDDDWKLSNKK